MSKPDPDLTEFVKLSKPKKPPCRVGVAAAQLSAEDVGKLEAAAAKDPGMITNSAIQSWLVQRGHAASVSAIVSHRRATCTCNDE